MDLIIKICGLSSEETLEAALDAKADMIGLVFFPPSPRSVTPARAASLAAQARGRAEITALTVDMDEMGIAEIVDLVKPDWLQFHGAESPETVAATKQRFGRRVMKAIGVRNTADLDVAEHYAGIADRLLLDAKPPKGSAVPGGHGKPFNWNILEGFEPELPIMLSGGLHAGNVGEALRITRAGGVDVSSGIETAPGRKDPDLIRDFIAAARNAAKVLSSTSLAEKVAS